jgi:hypothetical protein
MTTRALLLVPALVILLVVVGVVAWRYIIRGDFE